MRRRTLLLHGGAAAVSAVLAGACSGGPVDTVTITAGEAGRMDRGYAEMLAGTLAAQGFPARAITTGGSVDSIQRLAARRDTVAIVLADSALAAATGEIRTPGDGRSIRAVGRLYQAYAQLVVPISDPAFALTDLAGRRLSVGGPGSGASLLGRRMLDLSGTAATMVEQPYPAALAALEGGRTDAVLLAGGIPVPELAAFALRLGTRLVDLDPVAALLQATFGNVYERVTIPSGTYNRMSAVSTVGLSYVLVCREDTDTELVATLARALVAETTTAGADQPAATPPFDPHELIDTPVPLHPAAVQVYRDWHG